MKAMEVTKMPTRKAGMKVMKKHKNPAAKTAMKAKKVKENAAARKATHEVTAWMIEHMQQRRSDQLLLQNLARIWEG